MRYTILKVKGSRATSLQGEMWSGFQDREVKVKCRARSNIWLSCCDGRWNSR